MTDTNIYAVVMAGGSGTRFWPLSRRNRPKQFLSIGTDRSLIEKTVERLEPLLPLENFMVVAGTHHVPTIREMLPRLPPENLVVEPCARNTAPCIGLAAIHIARRDPNAVMAVLPADHHISDASGFRRLVQAAAERARGGEIVTLGIRPNRPETGYGYIRFDKTESVETSDGTRVYEVEQFVEKPNVERAREYIADGGYLWNSGMFFFTAQRILDDLDRFLPKMSAGMRRIAGSIGADDYQATLEAEFGAFQGISIDYGVMERAVGVRVIPADIGWNDVGHWAAITDFAHADAEGNVATGPTVLVDATDNVIRADRRLIAAVGVHDLVIVDTPDALLVVPRAKAQDVRKIVDRLREDGREDLL